MAMFADGLPHSREELRTCLNDDMGALNNVRAHITNLRKLIPADEAIVCELYRATICYRHIVLVNSPRVVSIGVSPERHG